MIDAIPGAVDTEQRAVCEQAEHDLRMVLKSLLEPYMNELAHIREASELIQAAHDIIESVMLERGAGRGQPDPAIDRILRKVAEDSKSAPRQTSPVPTIL
jgi:hypothetical protein